jgi:cell filamentation protein, protein adenylyltransferase
MWLLLGEARAKCEQVEDSLLKPETGQKLHRLYLARGALATTAIEGNTLSEEEAVAAVEGTLELPPSRDYLRREIDNVIGAYNRLHAHVLDPSKPPIKLTPEGLASYNEQILRGLELDEGVVAGEIRKHDVGVARYKAPPADECAHLLERLCEWLEGPDFRTGDTELTVVYAIVKAVLAHLYLAWIHPFGDGNGRTARLVEFQILLSAGVPTPAAHLLSSHYNATRTEYYRQLDRASRSGETGKVIPFLVYAVRGFVDGLREQLETIWRQQFADRWEQYIYETFGQASSPPELRRRRLTLDLSIRAEPVPKSRIRVLSPELATMYADKTDKTLTRDLNAVHKMGLILIGPQGIRANTNTILAFMPAKASA